MSARFRELAWSRTEMGVISLRRRTEPSLGVEIYEVKLDDEFLMSSLFTTGETQLARLGLAESVGENLDVVVGGLGLGYTARAVLEDPRVRSMVVVEALEPVVEWHTSGLLVENADLVSDPRTRLVHGDFFAMLRNGPGLDPAAPEHRFHAILLDIDHSPGHVLHPSHAAFYTVDGIRSLTSRLHPAGVFALWSDDSPDPGFMTVLHKTFQTAHAHVVTFPNPLTGGESASTVYVARHDP